MVAQVGAWAVSCAALIAGSAFGAQADPAAPAVALFVDLDAARLPGNIAGGQKQVDLKGLPVLIAAGPTTNVGVAGNYRLELDPHLSIDSHGSIGRMRVDSLAGLARPGMERGNGRASLHYSRDWLDLAVTPGATAEGPGRGMALAYSLDNRATIRGPFGWELATGSHFAQRSAPMSDGTSGAERSADLGITHRAAAGSSFGVGYSYGWSSPESAAVSFAQEIAVSADLAFMADVSCRAEYRQGLAAGTPQNLALGMDWDLAARGFGATDLTADLALQRNDPAADPGALNGTAKLSLAMKF